MRRIYKLLDAGAWDAARMAGAFTGSGVDLKDGYIHFSDGAQAAETARLHFKGQKGLVLLTVDADRLGPALKWEPSRGGALFPHLYAALPVEAVLETRSLALDDDGVPQLGPLP